MRLLRPDETGLEEGTEEEEEDEEEALLLMRLMRAAVVDMWRCDCIVPCRVEATGWDEASGSSSPAPLGVCLPF